MNTLTRAILLCTTILATGCASRDYATYIDAQKSISKDVVVSEAAKVNAIIEMTKSADPAVRATGIMLLQQLQQSSKVPAVEPPRRNWLGF